MATQTTSEASQELQKHEQSECFTIPDPTMAADPVTTRTIITFATRSLSVTQERNTSTDDSESRKSQTSFLQSDASTVTPESTASDPDTAVREEHDILTAATKEKIYLALRDSISTLVRAPTEDELKEVWTYALSTIGYGAEAAARPSIMGDGPNPAMRGRYIVATEPQPESRTSYVDERHDYRRSLRSEQYSFNSNSRHGIDSESSYRSDSRRDEDPSERRYSRSDRSYYSRRSYRG